MQKLEANKILDIGLLSNSKLSLESAQSKSDESLYILLVQIIFYDSKQQK